jgi:hypothetical protein
LPSLLRQLDIRVVDGVAVEDVDIAVKWVLERGVDPGDAGYVNAFFPGLQLAPGQMAVDRVVTSRARGRGKKRLISCRYFLTGAGLQVQTHRYNYPCKSSPVGKYLQARCAESRLSALGLCRSVEYPFVEKKRRLPRGRFVEFIRAPHEDKTKGES